MKKNGFRINFIQLYKFHEVKVQLGLRMAAAGFFLWCATNFTGYYAIANFLAAIISIFFPNWKYDGKFAHIGYKPTFNKEGLTGDNLKLVEMLEQRMQDIKGIPGKEEVENQIKEALKPLEAIRAFAEKKIDAEKLAELMGEGEKGIRSILLKQGEEITKLKELGAGKDENLSVRQQVAKWMEANKTAIEAIRAKQSNVHLPVMTIRAPITMTVGASLGSSAYLPNAGVAPGVVDLVRVKPTFWNRLRKGATKLNPYIWVNKTNKQGNAQFIGEGTLKPLASFELETQSSVPKKVAERMKASTELLSDVAGMTSMIENEIRFEVETAANAAVLTGVESSTNPKGVTKYASLFTLTTIETTNPTNMDAIRAAVAQIRSLNFDGEITAYINPIDAANMELAKGADGHYILPPFTSLDGRNVGGATVIEDNNIEVGYLLIGDMSKYKVQMYEEFFVQWGWENDDFSKNLMTVIGEMRFHQYVSDNHVGAFIYDTFANIKTAITA